MTGTLVLKYQKSVLKRKKITFDWIYLHCLERSLFFTCSLAPVNNKECWSDCHPIQSIRRDRSLKLYRVSNLAKEQSLTAPVDTVDGGNWSKAKSGVIFDIGRRLTNFGYLFISFHLSRSHLFWRSNRSRLWYSVAVNRRSRRRGVFYIKVCWFVVVKGRKLSRFWDDHLRALTSCNN